MKFKYIVVVIISLLCFSIASCNSQTENNDNPIVDPINIDIEDGEKKDFINFSQLVNDSKAYFKWNSNFKAESREVVINSNERIALNEKNEYELSMELNHSYVLDFYSYNNDTIISKYTTIVSYIPEAKNVEFTRMEIETKNYVLPSYENKPKEGSMFQNIVNTEYVSSIVKVYSSTNDLLYDSSKISVLNPYLGAKIRIKGNTSALGLKKNYKLDLSSKQGFFNNYFAESSNGNGEYVLHSTGDELYEVLGRKLSNRLISESKLNYTYVSLFMNGDFLGIYILVEAINEKTININNDGFIFQVSPYYDNNSFETHFYNGDSPLRIKVNYPKSIDLASNNFILFKNLLIEFEDSLIQNIEEASNYIDISSFVSWILIHDILSTHDSMGSNMIFYIKSINNNPRIYAGPAWDFDSIMYDENSFSAAHIDSWSYYHKLFRNETFLEYYKQEFKLVKTQLFNIFDEMISELPNNYYNIQELECLRIYENDTIYTKISNMRDFLNNHLSYLEEELADSKFNLSFYDNKDNLILSKKISKGEMISLPEGYEDYYLYYKEDGHYKYLPSNKRNYDFDTDMNLYLSKEFINIWEGYNVSFEGVLETNDNPFDYTANIISSEDFTNCIFLTPNTSVIISDIKNDLELKTQIFKQVANASNGCLLRIELVAANTRILETKDILVDNSGNWQLNKLELSNYSDLDHIILSCLDTSNNYDCDWLVIKNCFISKFDDEGYVKSATYFANEWAINFWNSELDSIDDDLIQIKNDGFDSIILVIPWKEFQIATNPIEYNDYAFNQLKFIMDKTLNYGLNVYTRIGYSWDFYNDSNEDISQRYLKLFYDNNTILAWGDYCIALYDCLSSYSNFKDAFLTWEDFWGTLSLCNLTDVEARLSYARLIGYQDYIEANYNLNMYNQKYSYSYSSYDDILLPYIKDEEMELFYEFYDYHLNEVLSLTQEYFPNCSMEVRLDSDLVYLDDSFYYYSHEATYDCMNSDFTATMYGIPMGCENNGERISYLKAMQNTEYILKKLYLQNGEKPVYIEQFLFMDNTPKFSYNAQIEESQINDYLMNVSEVLKKYSNGYGIWTYKNYCFNMIYNNGFYLEDVGWNVSDNIEFETIDGSKTCHLVENSVLMQEIPNIRDHSKGDKYIVSFDVKKINNSSKLLIEFGTESKEITVDSLGKYELEFNINTSFDIKISVLSGDLSVDNVRLYNFIQDGGLYSIDGSELDYIIGIRQLNLDLGDD